MISDDTLRRVMAAYCAGVPLQEAHDSIVGDGVSEEDFYLAWKGAEVCYPPVPEGTFHHVYPMPGCEVSILGGDEQVRAMKILREWNDKDPDPQGCIFRGNHRFLSEGEVAIYRSKGFYVERDWEDPDQ